MEKEKTQIPILTAPSNIEPQVPAELNAQQQQSLDSLRKYVDELLLPESDPYHEAELKWADDACLRRYLRAAKWHLKEAKTRIKYTIEWRRDYKPDEIDPKDVEHETVTGKLHLNGFDRNGRPILHLRPGRENTKAGPGQVRHVVFYFESGIRIMPEGVENVVVLVDFDGSSPRTSPGLGIAKEFMHVLSSHYVERLGLALIINAPWYFWTLFRLLSPFIDPVTKSKILFVDLNKPDRAKHSQQWVNCEDLISSDQLESEYGGKNAFEHNHETYWRVLLERTGRS